jgi:hypothetical protein
MELARRHHLMIADMHTWMPQGKDHRRSMHAYIWESGRVRSDRTIQLASWLVNSIDLSEDARDDFILLLTELNSLDDSSLALWNEHNYDAPWGHIYNLVLSSKQENIELQNTMCDLVVKVSRHPKLFRELNEEAFVVFTKALFSSELPATRTEAKQKLKPIVSVLSNSNWERTSSMSQLYLPALASIQVCLRALHNDGSGQMNEEFSISNRIRRLLSTFSFGYYTDGDFDDDSIRHASTS